MALNLGRTGRVYVKKESAYADTGVTFSATDALRHVELGMEFQPFNRVPSPEKTSAAGLATRFDRRLSAALGSLNAVIRPSGTLNTLPEADEIFECAFGAKTNVTLATTFSGTPTTTTGTVASAGTLAVGDGVLITRNSVKYVRVLTVVAGADLTWAPALPTAPTAGESLKGAVTYKCTTNLALSLAIAHYLANFKRLLLGVGADDLNMIFDANEEPRFELSGPAATQLSPTGVPADPGTFTTVGTVVPSGMVGELLVNDTAYKFKHYEASLKNTLAVRNQEYGQAVATEVYRNGKREVMISFEAFVENQATLHDVAYAGTPVSILKQTGRTEGSIIACWSPKVDFDVPETDDPDEAVSWAFEGTALASAEGQNNELTLVLA